MSDCDHVAMMCRCQARELEKELDDARAERDAARADVSEVFWPLSCALAELRGETCGECGREWGDCADSDCANGDWFRAGLAVFRKWGWTEEKEQP